MGLKQQEERREEDSQSSSESQSSTHQSTGTWQIIMDALRGKGGSTTDGPLTNAILFLAIPMVLEMVMESVFAVVDIFFVSKLGSLKAA